MIHDSKLPDRKRNPRHLTFGGANQACVVDDVGLNCWGGTVWPQIKNVRALAASENHTCALGENGVQCWGDDRFGQSKVPTTLVNPRAISVAVGKSCALVCP
jgi:alpha-tubulin suppressor-like RCC1 family protein